MIRKQATTKNIMIPMNFTCFPCLTDFIVWVVLVRIAPVTLSETAMIRASRIMVRFPVIRDRSEVFVPLIIPLLNVDWSAFRESG